jgi:hypothetical protein
MAMGIARDAVGWLGVLLALTGFVVCALHLGRTRWALVLAVGFALQTFVMAFNRLAMSLLTRGALGGGSVETAFLLSSVFGVVGSAAIVGGLAGVLSELKRVTEQPATPPV